MCTPEEFKSIMEYTRDELRKQLANMVHENGYGSQAVPKATIESLPALVKYDEWTKIEDKRNADWCKGYEARAMQEKFNNIANGRD